MTTTHPPALASRLHTVVGTPDQLVTVVANATTNGRLVSMSAPMQLADGRVVVRLRLRIHPTPPTTVAPHPARPHPAQLTHPAPRWQGRRRLLRVAALAVVVLGAATGIAFGVLAVLHLLSTLWTLLVGLAVIGVFLLLHSARPGGGNHCPGCGH